MKWVSHKALTWSFIYAVTGDLLMAGVSMLGSLVPDVVEGLPYSPRDYSSSWAGPQGSDPDPDPIKLKNWQRRHRRLSHWLPLYAVPAWLLLSFCLGNGIWGYLGSPAALFRDTLAGGVSPMALIPLILCFFLIGSSLHIWPQDYVSGGVPVWNPYKRQGYRFIKTGSAQEYLFSFAICLALIGIRWFANDRVFFRI